MKDGIEKEHKEKIIDFLKILFPKAKIYLFGSRARGDFRTFSDIDIAIDEGGVVEPIRRIGEAREMLNASYIPYTIEVVDLYRMPEEMRKIVLKEGIRWM